MSGRTRSELIPDLERAVELSAVLFRHRTQVVKISRKELARRSGVSESNIQAIEKGRTKEPGIFTVIALAVSMNLDLSSMMLSRTGVIRPGAIRELSERAVKAAHGVDDSHR